MAIITIWGIMMKSMENQKTTPLITISILSYNRPELLREALLSVLVQKDDWPMHVRILDNGSRIPVKDSVSDLLDEDVEWVGAESGHDGFWNLRRAISLTDSEFLMIMHDDDRILPGFVKSMCSMISENPDWVGITCNAYFIDELGDRNGRLVNERDCQNVLILESPAQVVYWRTMSISIPFPSMIYRVEAVKQIDFGEGVFGGAADAIFICDLAGKGKLVYVNEPKWEYRQHSGQASKSIEEKFNKNLELELIRIAGTESSISQPTIKAIRRISTERRLLRIWGNDNNANLVQRVLLSGRELLDSRTSMDGFADFARIKAWLFLRDSRR